MFDFIDIHPVIVHFPIACLVLFVFFEILFFFSKKNIFNSVGNILLILGILFMLISMLTGNKSEEAALILMKSNINIPKDLIINHRENATIAFWIFISIAVNKYYIFIKKNQFFFNRILNLILSIAGFYFLFQAAKLGGELVYKFGVGTDLLK